MRTTLTFALCFSLLWQTAVAQPLAQVTQAPLPSLTAPNQQILFVTPAELAQLKNQNPDAKEYRLQGEEAKVFLAQYVSPDHPYSNSPSASKTQSQPSPNKTQVRGQRPQGQPINKHRGSNQGAAINPVIEVRGSSDGVTMRPHLEASYTTSDVRFSTNFFNFNHFGGSDDLALVLLVIATVMIVAVIVVYAYQFLSQKYRRYQYEKRREQLAEDKRQELLPEQPIEDRYRYQLATAFDSYSYTPAEDTKEEQLTEGGNLVGLGLRLEKTTSRLRLGLQAELGQLSGKFILDDLKSSYQLTSLYGLVGPTVNYQLSDTFALDLALLAGTTQHKMVGLMSLARFSLSAQIEENLFIRGSLGSLYVGLKESQGLIRHKNNFNLISGVSLGYNF